MRAWVTRQVGFRPYVLEILIGAAALGWTTVAHSIEAPSVEAPILAQEAVLSKAVVPETIVQEVQTQHNLYAGMNAGAEPNGMGLDAEETNSMFEQVTSVSQLSDVQPTDWAFQALQSLVERYG
ncbi:MAG: hypothetical protein MH252_08755, partial [Thermosynechococcaceae cyanobacterium MS004]|nr:hypothetical protein [Thermosynechococcaceae cyanobacterium MS004]